MLLETQFPIVNTIPVHVIAGFLGAGKSTLMNHCLHSLPDDRKVAIVVNDFGEVAIDAALIDRGDYAMKTLSSGCVCCTLAGPLTESLVALADDQQPDMIVMETTGIAEPAQIAALVSVGAPAERVHIGNILCVLDSSSFTKYESHFEIMRKQVEQANAIVLNKVDLAAPDLLEAVRSRVAFLAQPDALVLETQHCAVDAEALYAERPVYLPANPVADDHGRHFHSCTLEFDDTLVLTALRDYLEGLDDSVVRAKGMVQTDQGWRLVQKSLSGVDISDWPEASSPSRLVFVGSELDRAALKLGLDGCRRVP